MRDTITVWIKKVKENNLESFPKTAESESKDDICFLIIDHLTLLQKKINHYFSNLNTYDYAGLEIHLFQLTQETFLMLKKKN